MTAPDAKLLQAALTARSYAYAPYSQFCVGAALQLRDGRIVSGANIENCSYGLTICAERSAIASAVMQGLEKNLITSIVVVADSPYPAAPCGACRQVLAEFAAPETPVFMHNVRDGKTCHMPLGELLPMAFSANALAPTS